MPRSSWIAPSRETRNRDLSQLRQQSRCLEMILGGAALGEPVINGLQQFERWLSLALADPEAGEGERRLQLERLRFLPARHLDGLPVKLLGFDVGTAGLREQHVS